MGIGQFGTRVAVIGGGIAGLTAAYHLQADDDPYGGRREVHLFEAGQRLGGVLHTEQVEGFRLELGPDSMLSRLPWGLDLCRQLGVADELIGTSPSQRGVYVVCRGRLQRVPQGLALVAPQRIWPFVTTPILSFAGKLRLFAEPLIARRTAEEDESLADFGRRRLGREAFDRLVQPLAGGIYMGDPELLSVRATFPQFVEMETKHRSLMLAARAGAKGSFAHKSSGGPAYSMFVAPRRGMQQLVDSLVKGLDPRRVHIHCRSRVEKLLSKTSEGWVVDIVNAATRNARRETFAGVVIATPAHQAAGLLADADPHLSGLLEEIPYAGCVVVNLAFERDAVAHPLDSFGFIVPHVERRSVLACTFCSVKYAHRAPDGGTLLRLFLGGGCHPEVLDWSDERVVGVVRSELQDLLGVERPPLFSRIKRWRRSMPQYHLGHLPRVQRIEERVRGLPGLVLAGNAYHGVGIPHCIRSGKLASERLVAALNETCQPQA